MRCDGMSARRKVRGHKGTEGEGRLYGKRMGRARFADAGFNSADARDGILLPVVIDHNGLRFRL